MDILLEEIVQISKYVLIMECCIVKLKLSGNNLGKFVDCQSIRQSIINQPFHLLSINT